MPQTDVIAPIATSGRTWLRPDFSSPMRAASYATGSGGGRVRGARG